MTLLAEQPQIMMTKRHNAIKASISATKKKDLRQSTGLNIMFVMEWNVCGRFFPV